MRQIIYLFLMLISLSVVTSYGSGGGSIFSFMPSDVSQEIIQSKEPYYMHLKPYVQADKMFTLSVNKQNIPVTSLTIEANKLVKGVTYFTVTKVKNDEKDVYSVFKISTNMKKEDFKHTEFTFKVSKDFVDKFGNIFLYKDGVFLTNLQKTGSDDLNYFYTVTTQGFSEFKIVGKIVQQGGGASLPQIDLPITTVQQEEIPEVKPFELKNDFTRNALIVLFVVMSLIAVGLYVQKKKQKPEETPLS